MARPRRGTEDVWFDTFTLWPEEDRAAAIKVLEHLHRALVRESRRGAFARVDTPDNADLLERNAALDLEAPNNEAL